jgi:O-antigen ligase
MMIAALANFMPSTIMLIPLGLIAISSVFFSRGILIFLTALSLSFAQSPSLGMIASAAIRLRWIFFALFVFHVFGDIFLGRTVRKVKTFDVLAIFFIFYAFLSAFYSPYPSLTLERTTTVLALYISVFWIIWKYAYEQGPEKIVDLILKVTTLLFIMCYLMIFIGPDWAFTGGRLRGIFLNPNSLGLTCAILLPLSHWQFLETKKRTALFLFFLMLVGLFLSGSRNSINATIITMGYFTYMRSRKFRPLILFTSMSLILMLFWAIQTLAKLFFHTYYRTETIPTMGGRLEVWPFALDLIVNKPFFGYGFGVEEKLFPLKYTPLFKSTLGYIHNSYLGIMVQLGMLGFILFFTPLFILLFKELFSKQDSEVPLLRHALRASLLVGLLCCIFESWVYSVGNAQAFPFWIIVMLLVFYRYQDKEKPLPEST